MSALQMWSPEFKPQSHQEKRHIYIHLIWFNLLLSHSKRSITIKQNNFNNALFLKVHALQPLLVK
jgi:hypothetical protein